MTSDLLTKTPDLLNMASNLAKSDIQYIAKSNICFTKSYIQFPAHLKYSDIYTVWLYTYL